MGCDERLLQQIQCLVRLADARPHHPEYRLAITSHDLGKGGVTTGDAERRQLAVRKRGQSRLMRPTSTCVVGERLHHGLIELAGLIGPQELPHRKNVRQSRFL